MYEVGLWHSAAAIVLSVTLFVPCMADQNGQEEEYLRLLNAGRAALENREAARSVAAFEAAVNLRPDSAPAWRNVARARMLSGKWVGAGEALERANELASNHAATNYLRGLVHVRLAQFDAAVSFLETAARLDANTAALRYQLALAYQAIDRQDRAVEQLRETLRLDPLHSGAHFRLSAASQKAGDQEAYLRHLTEYRRVRLILGDQTRTPEAFERCTYTEAETGGPPVARPLQGPSAVRFVDGTELIGTNSLEGRITAVSVLNVTDNGTCVLITATSDGRVELHRMDASGSARTVDASVKLAAPESWMQVLVGDYYNQVPQGARYDPAEHAHNDVLFVGTTGVHLLRNEGTGSLKDVTAEAGLVGTTASRAAWCDYEHDGDVDLLLARDSGLALWQNNGNGRFQEVSGDVGLEMGGPFLDVLAIELDGNVATDLIAAGGASPTLVFLNQRAGRFERMTEPPGPWPAAQRVLANDLNNDSHADVLLVRSDEADMIFGRRPSRMSIRWAPLKAVDSVLFDFDNDGWLDLCVAGQSGGEPLPRGALRIWRNAGEDEWVDVSEAIGLTGLDLPPVRSVTPVDIDVDGDTDLLALTADGRLRMLRNEGGNVHGQLKIKLMGTKTNPGGLGTHVEVRAAGHQVVRYVNALPIEIGLGNQQQIDAIQTVWTNGVVDNQIDIVPSRRPFIITEKNVAAGSCPFLYAWDGRKFRFVTDLLGNSPLGLSASRGVTLPADPDEIVVIGTEAVFLPVDERYRLQITSEFREVVFLDEVRLMVVDHSANVEVHPTDKLMPPPFPASEVAALSAPRVPRSAVGSDGVDRTEAVGALDGRFAAPGPPLPPPYRGMCMPMSLTLDFGPVDVNAPLALVLTGWLQYGDASTNIALSQNNSIPVIAPRLFAETQRDVWTVVDAIVGLPAGKTKAIVCDLTGALPAGTSRLRLETSFEVRWDRIALMTPAGVEKMKVRQLAVEKADLAWRGFSDLKSRAEGHPTTPDHGLVYPRPPWRTTPAGWCTRYGDVTNLLSERDNHLVVINAGDALTVDFPADRLPPVVAGQARTFFLFSVGWDKDADHNVVGGDMVQPLPRDDTVGSDVPLDGFPKDDLRWVPHDRDGVPPT